MFVYTFFQLNAPDNALLGASSMQEKYTYPLFTTFSFTTPILLLPFSPFCGPQLHLCYTKHSTLPVIQKPTYRNHPVGQVTVLRHLHSSKHCQINMASGNRKCVISIPCSSNSPRILTSFFLCSLHQF